MKYHSTRSQQTAEDVASVKCRHHRSTYARVVTKGKATNHVGPIAETYFGIRGFKNGRPL